MWLVMRFVRWEDVNLGGKMAPPEDGSIGFLDVFDDYDKALLRAEGDTFLVEGIRTIKEVQHGSTKYDIFL